MDTTDPLIVFNAEGHCNHCTDFINVRSRYMHSLEQGDEGFKSAIAKIKKKGKGRSYDCVMGISGGVDSSYVAFLGKEAGLRILAVHMDNGWNSEEANLNIKNITRKLGIDYESFVVDWEEFKDFQISFLKASVPDAETPTDIAIQGALHRVAAKYGIRYIVSGGNMASEGILPKCWQYNAKDQKYNNVVHRRFGRRRLRKFPFFSFWAEAYYKLVRGINTIYLLNYVPYIKENAMQVLKDTLDWRYYGGKHYESRYTSFIQSYYHFEKFPIDYRRATFSTMICTGEMSRDQALDILKEKPYNEATIEADKKYIAKKLGLSDTEFREILQLPPKFYFDYPNSEGLLNFIYNTYRKIYKKEKVANF